MLVCIDPGHGGEDPGAIGNLPAIGDVKEKDICLTASLILGGLLNSYNHRVMFTRTDTNETMSLDTRTDQANDADADLFVSIHCNSFTNVAPRGFEIYHYPGSNGGLWLSSAILSDVRELGWIELHGNNVKTANFYVLRHTSMVAVLMELSYMSNRKDLRLLMDTNKIYELMSTVAKAVDTYLTD